VSFVGNGFAFPIPAMTRDVGNPGDCWALRAPCNLSAIG
jgi:hypothetical protein